MNDEININQWNELAEVAVKIIRSSGAEYGDIRLLTSHTQRVFGQDRRIGDILDAYDAGFRVRVLYKGAWGFASSSTVSPEEIKNITALAIEIAKATSLVNHTSINLVEEPTYQDVIKISFHEDPFEVSLEEKTQQLLEVMELMQREPNIARSQASLWARRDCKLFVSTEGSHIYFDLLATQGSLEATAVLEDRFASRRYHTPYLRTGYERIRQTNFLMETQRVALQAVEKVKAPPIEPGKYDLILDLEHLSLTIHESCGHPSELDRALGYEANYAGTSFLSPDKRGNFRYGSPSVNLVSDNTEVWSLASTGYDDDGVACQRWDIIREGTFVGYCTNREVASRIGEQRSRGSNRADSWANVPYGAHCEYWA